MNHAKLAERNERLVNLVMVSVGRKQKRGGHRNQIF